MRKQIFLFSLAVMALGLQAQQVRESEEITPFFRNALTNMMVYHIEDEFGYDVYSIFKDLPPMDKYDNHDVGVYVLDNSRITGVRAAGTGFNRQTYGGSMVLTAAEKEANGQAMLRLLNEGDIAKKMVAKWFDLKGDSLQNAYFGTNVLVNRSDYNATILDVAKAGLTVDAATTLRQVGDELMSHSFVLVSDMTYITAENRADATKATFAVLGGLLDAVTGGNSGERLAEDVGDIADKFTGFKVMTHSYLFQLVWNDSIANIFYQNYYTETPNPERLRAFFADETTFRLVYLGTASAVDEKTTTKGRYNREDLLQMITVRSIDKNVAELQGRFEAFRVKAPITQVEYDKKGKVLGYRVPVGEKEGVKETTTFEVLQCKLEKGVLVYKRIGLIKPVKNRIWDNRFNALIENDRDGEISGTLFKLSGAAATEIMPGMLVRQVEG